MHKFRSIHEVNSRPVFREERPATRGAPDAATRAARGDATNISDMNSWARADRKA